MKIVLFNAILYFYRFLNIVILVYCIGSWFVSPGTRLFDYWRKLGYFLEPLFRPARAVLELLRRLLRNIFPRMGTIPVDFTPWLTVILLEVIFTFILNLIIRL